MNPQPPTPSDLLDLVERALDEPPDARDAWLREHARPDTLDEARRLLELAQSATGHTWTGSVPASASLEGRRIGAFVIERLLGEGGMGQVYLARRDDGEFDQTVAIKVMRAAGTTAAINEQFELERQVLANLRHPNIASLLDGGTTDDGLHYVVMEFVDGRVLSAYLEEASPTIEEIVALFIKLCRAVQSAHESLVIHRDIKPGNILVDADGEPKLLDFGIAKVLSAGGRTADASQTILGAMTPAYASPEHIRGASLTTASDVYSLGVVLYEALAGTRPFDTDGLSPAQTERLLTTHSAARPSDQVASAAVRQALRGDLDAIVLRALAPERARRYGTAGELADDLERFVRGQPVSAQPDSAWYRLRKLVGRNRAASLAIGAMLVAVLGGLGVALWQANVAREQTALAQQQLARTAAVSDFLGDILLSPSANWDSEIQTGTKATIADVLDAAEAKLNEDLADQPRVRVELLMRISEARLWMEQPERAEQLAKRAVEIVDEELTDDAQLRVETRYHIAAALAEKDGQERAAIAQYTAAMDEARRLGLEGSLVWLYILNDRAMTHMALGESAAALTLMSDAIAGLHTLMGDEVLPSWGVGYNNLAFAQFLEGDLEGAAASYERALLGCETFPEQNALTTASVLNNYANVRAMQGDADAAIAMHERALVISRPLLERGGGEEDFGLSASGLAVQQCRAGNPDLGRRALGEVETHLAHYLDDPVTWIYFYARSVCALAEGDAPAAVVDARQAIEVGSRARRTVDAVSRQQAALARALRADGRADEASSHAQSAVAAYEQWFGSDHPVTRRVRAELSVVR